EKVAESGAVTLKEAGRSVLVESREDGEHRHETVPAAEQPVSRLPQPDVEDEEPAEAPPAQTMEGVRAVQQALAQASPRWPMYVHQMKQFLKNAISGFDERRFGFSSVVDLLRAAQKAGVLRIERDRQGGMRIFPGAQLTAPIPVEAVPVEDAAREEI